jgi:RNA polymerase sigma-70 factor, ECF subfamily
MEQSMAEAPEEVQFVTAARNGARAAFERLYDRYTHMLYGVLLTTLPLSEVDDLVQDVFLLALRRLATLREIGRFGAWLAAIARNRANDFHRRSVPDDQLADEAPENDIEQPHASADHHGPAAAILDATRALPDAYRETLILRLVEGMIGPEIATRTGLTHGSVRVNPHAGAR